MLHLILNGKKKTHFRAALVAFAGLPKSGKTTLVETLLPHSTASKEFVEGLATYEIGIPMPPGGDISDSPWEEFTQEDAHIYMLACALASECKEECKFPSLKPWSDHDMVPNLLKPNEHLQNEFKKVYEKMTKILPRVTKSPYFHCILKPTLVLMNIWDIGVSKALYEVLPLLARVINPLVLVNLLDLARDSKKLTEVPQLTRKGDKKFVMKFRSRCHYYARIAGFCISESERVQACVPVATHKDQVPSGDIKKESKLTEAAIFAKATDMGISDILFPNMITIDARSKKDGKKIQNALGKIVCSSKQFEADIRLTWIFLHTALIDYKGKESKFCLSYGEFSDLAKLCGLTSLAEVEEFLKFFTQIGSLSFVAEFFSENVIYKPDIFFQELNKLYTPTTGSPELQEHAKCSYQMGILCRSVANEYWENDVEFFWKALQESGLAAQTRNDGPRKYDYGIKCPYCPEKECLFVPSLRYEYKEREPDVKVDSLFITFNSEYVPIDVQPVIVRHMKSALRDAELKLANESYCNSTRFNIGQVSVEVLVHGDVVEILTEGGTQGKDETQKILHKLKHLCVKVLEGVIVYFPGMAYELGFICPESKQSDPLQRRNVHYLHFLPSQCEKSLPCVHCQKEIPLRLGQQKWMSAADITESVNRCSCCDMSPCNYCHRLCKAYLGLYTCRTFCTIHPVYRCYTPAVCDPGQGVGATCQRFLIHSCSMLRAWAYHRCQLSI